MHKVVILLLCCLLRLGAQSEINVSGGSFSNGLITLDWNITCGLQDLYAAGPEVVKLGTLQPTFSKITLEDSLSVFNFVTANKDGKNDFFYIEGLQRTKPHELCIFNRLGNIVFRTNDYQNNWDGDELEPGTYFYVLKYNNSEFKDSIFLSK